MSTKAGRRTSDSVARVPLHLEPLESRLLLSSATSSAALVSLPADASTPIFCPATGHYYELVLTSGLSWQASETAAESASYLGVKGHLATITTQAESDFITNEFVPHAGLRIWIGGYKSPDSPNPDVNWHWVTGEPWGFTNWDSGEPDNNGPYGQEDWLDLSYSDPGKWNDESAIPNSDGYIVEFDTGGNTFLLGQGGVKSLKFSDADGTNVTLKLKGPGSATVDFQGEGILGQEKGNSLILTGTGMAIDQISLQDTSAHTSLDFDVRGGADGLTTVNSITGSTPLAELSAKGVDLTGGGIVMTGDGVISRVIIHDALNGSVIQMPGLGAKTGVQITADNLGPGAEITLGSGLRSLVAASWGASNLQAPWASSVRIGGDSAANISLSAVDHHGQSLGQLTVKGTMDGAAISLAGGAGSITAARWNGGSLSADDLESLRIIGNPAAWMSADLNQVQVALTGQDRRGYSLGNALIAGRFDNSDIIASHSVNSFVAGHLSAGSVLAVAVEPGSNGYFSIDDVGTGGRLNFLEIGGHDTDNGGVPFGIVADNFGIMILDGQLVSKSALPLMDGDAYVWKA